MSGRLSFELKWTPRDPSTSIILTFNARWLQPILAGEISVIFRKHGPNTFTPETIYAYFSAPSSAIAARMPVRSWERLPLAEAIKHAANGRITEEELRAYGSRLSHLLVITVGRVDAAQTAVTQKFLTERFQYWPSSTFIPLSTTGARTLDKLAQFASSQSSA